MRALRAGGSCAEQSYLSLLPHRQASAARPGLYVTEPAGIKASVRCSILIKEKQRLWAASSSSSSSFWPNYCKQKENVQNDDRSAWSDFVRHMFINTGGFPEHHSDGKQHLQPQRHHHGHRHPQQFGQHHQPGRIRRLTACGRRLFPDPRHHGCLSPAALLLKPRTPHPPLFLALTLLLTSHLYHPTHLQPPSSPLHRTAQRPHD